MKVEQRYWDSVCFLGWLKNEQEKQEACRNVLEAVDTGRLLIVTSAITLVEVIKLKGATPVNQSDSETIERFFKNHYIRVQNVDRKTAEIARSLIWKHKSIQPKDAIHLATAKKHQISIFDTFDEQLIKFDGKIGQPAIKIGRPHLETQTDLFE